jgi:hypothetical protein
MTVKQTVDIPPSRRLTIDVPREIPAGRTIVAFTPAKAVSTDSWRSLYGICKDSGDTLDAFLERKHADRERESAAMERRLKKRENSTEERSHL